MPQGSESAVVPAKYVSIHSLSTAEEVFEPFSCKPKIAI